MNTREKFVRYSVARVIVSEAEEDVNITMKSLKDASFLIKICRLTRMEWENDFRIAN